VIIKVNTSVPYSVIVENGAIKKLGEVAAAVCKKNAKVMVISDTNVFPLYGEGVMESLEKCGLKPFQFVFEAGEESKNLGTVSKMYRALAENQFTRSDMIVTLGGGVTGDMGGFAAATYLRGIDYIQVPTSLLAQVDSSVGGKTGVDLPYGKNLVGAFHQPKAVISDPSVLQTLPKDYFTDGMGEVVKYGCIWDKDLFFQLETGAAVSHLEDTICKCIDCKRQLVEEDARDTGRRMILNFGHTFGHALEKLHGFQGLSHGRAVAIGMLMATKISESMHLTKQGTAARLEELLKQMDLPTVDTEFTTEQIIDATALDKKNFGKTLNLIFLEEIGQAFIHQAERNYLVLRCKIMEEQNARNGRA
jgi:3-dehydroquinate synthase